MSDKNQDFDKYLKDDTEWAAPVKKEVAEYLPKKKEYRAVERFKVGDKVTERFKIVDKDGNFDVYSYTHLVEISYRSSILTLSTTSRNFVLTGQNIAEIADLISERKLKAIHEFNPTVYINPDDEKAVVIELIERSEN